MVARYYFQRPVLFSETTVPRTGFEPAHLAAPPPEDGASTNFATWAGQQNYADLIDDIMQIQKYLAMR